jgi:hypothetical protein
LRGKSAALKEALAELLMENRLLKKSEMDFLRSGRHLRAIIGLPTVW